MLFNSYEFVFLFLPVTVAVFFLVGRYRRDLAIGWLVVASLFFYGWWNPIYLVLLMASMAANFALGEVIARAHAAGRLKFGRSILTAGVVFNLGLLGYYKYAGFLVDNLNALAGADLRVGDIVLPLAISFFTFQQIAYLVDAHKGITREGDFSHYALFVTFFPQLIAGPIVHHTEMLPQFAQADRFRFRFENVSVGTAIFAIGLFKKTVLADSAALYSSPVFDAAAAGDPLTFFQAWGGAMSYTMQLYFDFSGYSDMAIGAARLFGIRLPLNFHSPYKATNIIEFWRRWHITLSRFLRDYLYIPLGGNRRGKGRRYANLLTTMLLGGLWHGAGWTFVIWGGLHGAYLVINHAWSRLTKGWAVPMLPHCLTKALCWVLTFTAVVVGWVFFRAADVHAATAMIEAMTGSSGVALPNAIMVRLGELGVLLQSFGVGTYLGGGTQFVATWAWLAVLLPIALVMPNTQQIMDRVEPALNRYSSDASNELRVLASLTSGLLWRPTFAWAVLIGITAAVGVLAMASISEFLYFQF